MNACSRALLVTLKILCFLHVYQERCHAPAAALLFPNVAQLQSAVFGMRRPEVRFLPFGRWTNPIPSNSGLRRTCILCGLCLRATGFALPPGPARAHRPWVIRKGLPILLFQDCIRGYDSHQGFVLEVLRNMEL
jgi:hypothetical protein